MQVWFTGDFHLGHERIIEHCNRPFKSEVEMSQYVLDLILSNVRKQDVLYILGDVGWKNWSILETVLAVCPTETFVLFGSHDKRWRNRIEKMVKWAGDFKEIQIDGQKISLFHYAMRVWPSSHWGAWQLYAHSHGKLPPLGLQHDVGLDNNNYQLVSFDLLREIMKDKKPHHLIVGGSEVLEE
jgi:calcineurin-like phosphoesterase family protein